MTTSKWITVFFLLFVNIVFGQNHLMDGAKWYFEEPMYAPYIGISEIQVLRDTTINGQACKILEGECNCAVSELKYVYYDSNKYFRYDKETEAFYLLYDFSKQAGESWELFLSSSAGSVTINVDSIAEINFDNLSVPLSVQFISYDEIIDFGQYVIPGIGSNKCLFPQGNICDPQTARIRCFEYSSGLILTTNPSISCDSIISSTSFIREQEELKLYPNPSDGRISIENDYGNEIRKIEVYSINGKLLYQSTDFEDSVIKLNLNFLSNGISIIRVFGDNWSISKKIVKQ